MEGRGGRGGRGEEVEEEEEEEEEEKEEEKEGRTRRKRRRKEEERKSWDLAIPRQKTHPRSSSSCAFSAASPTSSSFSRRSASVAPACVSVDMVVIQWGGPGR